MSDPQKTKKHRGLPKPDALPPPLIRPAAADMFKATANERHKYMKMYSTEYTPILFESALKELPMRLVQKIVTRQSSPLEVAEQLRDCLASEAAQHIAWTMLAIRDILKPLRQAFKSHEDFVLLRPGQTGDDNEFPLSEAEAATLRENSVQTFPSMICATKNTIDTGGINEKQYVDFWRCAAIKYLEEAFRAVSLDRTAVVTVGDFYTDDDQLRIFMEDAEEGGDGKTIMLSAACYDDKIKQAFAKKRTTPVEDLRLSSHPASAQTDAAVLEEWIDLITTTILRCVQPWRCALSVRDSARRRNSDGEFVTMECSLQSGFVLLPDVSHLERLVCIQIPVHGLDERTLYFDSSRYLADRKRKFAQMNKNKEEEEEDAFVSFDENEAADD